MSIQLKKLANNFIEITIDDRILYFSYETLVGFIDRNETFISENVWGKTTGKHLNLISEKKDRIPFEEFQEELKIRNL
jgi:hypothetical protein